MSDPKGPWGDGGPDDLRPDGSRPDGSRPDNPHEDSARQDGGDPAPPGASGGPPPGPVRNLSVRQTVVETYAALVGQAGPLLRLIALPALLQTAIFFLVVSSVDQTSGEAPQDPAETAQALQQLAVMIPLLFLSLLPMSVLGYGWLRHLLLGPAAAPRLWPAEIGPVFRFFFTFLGIAILSSLAALAVSNLGFLILGVAPGGAASMALILPVTLAALGVSVWLLLRLSLALPARALHEVYRLRDSWNQTKGQGMALFTAALATLFPVYMLGLIVTSLTPGMIGLPVAAFAMLLVQATLYALLASAFRQVSGWVPPS